MSNNSYVSVPYKGLGTKSASVKGSAIVHYPYLNTRFRITFELEYQNILGLLFF